MRSSNRSCASRALTNSAGEPKPPPSILRAIQSSSSGVNSIVIDMLKEYLAPRPFTRLLLAGLIEHRGGNLVEVILSAGRVGSDPDAHAADFLHGSLRADVVKANQKNDGAHETESVLQHE